MLATIKYSIFWGVYSVQVHPDLVVWLPENPFA